MSIATLARQFNRFCVKNAEAWPPALQTTSYLAFMALGTMSQRQFAQSESLQRMAVGDLLKFITSYDEWRAAQR